MTKRSTGSTPVFKSSMGSFMNSKKISISLLVLLGVISYTQAVCEDGIVNGLEQCDITDQGCIDCTIQPGYDCVNAVRAGVLRTDNCYQSVTNLNDCTKFAALFDVTSVPMSQNDYLAEEKQQCWTTNFCPQFTRERLCDWTRKFAVKCFLNSDGEQMIRVQTNSMPDHCMQSMNVFPEENDIDFQVRYNIRPSELKTLDIYSQTQYDNYACSNIWLSEGNLMKEHKFELNSGETRSVIGISLNGVPIVSGTSELGYDALAPKKYGANIDPQPIDVDLCLGTADYSRFYHYYSFSPCILPTDVKTNTIAEICRNIDECKKDKFKYSLSNLVGDTIKLVPIGIAKDGHQILSPFKTDTEFWQPCELDACNGINVNDRYYYVASMFHPYTVGCWGPANKETYTASCSSNARFCKDFSSFAAGLANPSVLQYTFGILLVISGLLFQ
eukprot:403354588